VVTDLPEQLISQAEFLVRNADSNEANVRRAVSSAYYALFHLLVRDAVMNWKYADHRSRLARTFDHKRMKDASTAILKEIGNARNLESADSNPEQVFRLKLSTVAQAFVDLQQARHKTDYDIAEPFQPLDAAVDVAQAGLAFRTWAEVRDEPLAQGYLYSMLFKDRS
jgi:hypothetical protein